MGTFSFKVLSYDKKTQARVGEITTIHGKIKTPAFVPVGTQATVKSLTPPEIKDAGTQVFFVNTYHTYLRPGVETIKKLGGLHQFMSWDGPLMTDSGGFQVFSLARNDDKGALRSGATLACGTKPGAGSASGGFRSSLGGTPPRAPSLVNIDNEGVTFKSHWDGSLHRFTPEKSIVIQQKLGADIILAFDQCTPYPASHDYAYLSMARTHRWSLRSLTTAQSKPSANQALYGIIQGSTFKDLRIESAKFIAGLPFSGIAIGGMAVGESKGKMKQALEWIMPYLPLGKPRHLLGVGEIDDIFQIVEKGIDTFDCVMPTRLGRMGHLLANKQISKYTNDKWRFDITKNEFAEDKKPPVSGCQCFTCKNFSRAYLHHLFRVHELLGYRLATIHNLYFLNHLVSQIRTSIEKGDFLELKKQWLV